MNYNLLNEKWIPVLYRCGKWKRVGIRTALGEAGQIRQIAASNPYGLPCPVGDSQRNGVEHV